MPKTSKYSKTGKKSAAYSMKVPESFNDRLYAAAERTKMPPATIALAAVEAALAAIERDGGIFMPVRMSVSPCEEGGAAPSVEPDLSQKIFEAKRIVENLARLDALKNLPPVRPSPHVPVQPKRPSPLAVG